MPRATGPAASVDPRRAAQAQQDQAMAGLGDFDLPRTTVTRLAKSQVGESAKLSQDVVSALIKSSTVFINYLAAAAHEHAEDSGRKTVAYQDVFQALGMIQYGGSEEGVQRMEKVLTSEIDAWDAIQKQAKNKPAGESSRGKNHFKSKSGAGSGSTNQGADNNNDNENENDGGGDGDEEEEEEEEREEDVIVVVDPSSRARGQGKGKDKAGAGEVDMDTEVDEDGAPVVGAATEQEGDEDEDEEPMEESDQEGEETVDERARGTGGRDGAGSPDEDMVMDSEEE